MPYLEHECKGLCDKDNLVLETRWDFETSSHWIKFTTLKWYSNGTKSKVILPANQRVESTIWLLAKAHV